MNKTRKLVAGNIQRNSIFDKIVSIGYEVETDNLVKLSLVNDGIEEYFMNTDTNANIIGMFETGGNEYTDKDELLLRMEEFYNINIGKKSTFYITNDVTTTVLSKKLDKICVDDEEEEEEEEEEEMYKENKKDKLYKIKIKDTKYPLKFIFSEKSNCSTFADVEWIITHYQPKHTPNIIIKTFIETFKHIIQHLDELSIEDNNGRLIFNMNTLDETGTTTRSATLRDELEIDNPLKRIFFHKPNTNMYYMNVNPNLKGINDISTTVQMTFASKTEDMFDIMKHIMRKTESKSKSKSESESEYDSENSPELNMFDKIEICVNELVEMYMNKEIKIKRKKTTMKYQTIVKQIKCLISCILYKIYVYCNIYLQKNKDTRKYFKNSMPLNIRHSNHILYKEIKKHLMKLFPNEANTEIANRVKTIIIQQEYLNKYMLENIRNVRRNAFLITNRVDNTNSNYGDPSYSLSSYFDFFEEPVQKNNINSNGENIDYDWFEYINLDTLSTKMEIKNDILLVESRNFPNLIAEYIYELTQDEYLKKFKRLKIETMRKFIELEQGNLSKSIAIIKKNKNKTRKINR